MAYTLGEAAKATGKSKATISKAIKTGRISANKGETGSFQIDPSELHRVYPPLQKETDTETPEGVAANTDEQSRLRELELRLELAEERLQDRDRALRDKDQEIADIRDQRDKWHEEARRAMALLSAPSGPSAERKSGALRQFLAWMAGNRETGQ